MHLVDWWMEHPVQLTVTPMHDDAGA